MKLGELIIKYRNDHGLSQRQFADKCRDVTNGYISMIENGKNPSTKKPIIPKLDKLKCIADAMGMPLHALLQAADDMPVELGNFDFEPVNIPVLGKIPAGVPLSAIEDIEGWEDLSPSMLRGGKEYIALAVKGESMLPEYRDGDVLILRKQEDCKTGDDCAVMVGNEDATFKRIRRNEKGITLQPLNPAYDPTFYTNQEVIDLPVRIIGVVVEIRRKIKR